MAVASAKQRIIAEYTKGISNMLNNVSGCINLENVKVQVSTSLL